VVRKAEEQRRKPAGCRWGRIAGIISRTRQSKYLGKIEEGAWKIMSIMSLRPWFSGTRQRKSSDRLVYSCFCCGWRRKFYTRDWGLL